MATPIEMTPPDSAVQRSHISINDIAATYDFDKPQLRAFIVDKSPEIKVFKYKSGPTNVATNFVNTADVPYIVEKYPAYREHCKVAVLEMAWGKLTQAVNAPISHEELVKMKAYISKRIKYYS